MTTPTPEPTEPTPSAPTAPQPEPEPKPFKLAKTLFFILMALVGLADLLVWVIVSELRGYGGEKAFGGIALFGLAVLVVLWFVGKWVLQRLRWW